MSPSLKLKTWAVRDRRVIVTDVEDLDNRSPNMRTRAIDSWRTTNPACVHMNQVFSAGMTPTA